MKYTIYQKWSSLFLSVVGYLLDQLIHNLLEIVSFLLQTDLHQFALVAADLIDVPSPYFGLMGTVK